MCIRDRPGIYFHLPFKQLFLVCTHLIPCRYFFWAWSELSILRDNTHLFLLCKSLFTQFIPSPIKFTFVFITPFFRNMMWSMQCSSGKVNIEGLVRRQRLLRLYPIDRLVSHVSREMITRCSGSFNPDGSIKNGGSPLILSLIHISEPTRLLSISYAV